MTYRPILRTMLTWAVLCLLCSASTSFASETPKLALFPFTVHSQGNADFLRKAFFEALAKELGKTKGMEIIDKNILLPLVKDPDLKESEGHAIARSLGATHAIMGSITELGETISVDAKIFDLSRGRAYPPIFVQGRGLGSITTLAAQLKGDVLIKVASRQRIVKIAFRGNQKIESAAINQVLKSTQGSLFSEATITEDIKAIYKLGYFDDVAVDVEDVPEGKSVTYIVKEKGLIVDILIKGNKAVDTGDIEGALSFKTKQTLSQEKIASSIEKIKALYDNKGYYNAEINHKIEKIGEKDIRVVFDIKENEKLYITKIAFEGNRTFEDKDLKNIMTTSEKGFFFFLTDSGILKKDQLKQDVGKINAYYLNHGFIKAQVGEPEITFDKKGIHIKITVTEGKRFTVGKVSITGDKLEKPREKLLEGLRINKKVFFDREAILKDIETLTQACHDEGYAYAEVNPRTSINEKEQSVDVAYDISKGHLVFFNRITITGNTKTRDKVIRRMLAFAEGELYNSTKLKNSYKGLEQLRYFEEIDFQSQRGPDEFLTDVNIRVKEKPTGMVSIGAGYSALDNAMFMAQVSQQNLFGKGQTLYLKATLGSVTSYYELSFIEPWLFDIPLSSKWDLWKYARSYDSYDVETDGGGLTLGYPLWEHFYGQVSYTLSNANVKNIKATASQYIKDQEGRNTTSIVGIGISRDTTDDNFFPTKGSINGVTWAHAGGILGGNSSFDKYGASSSWYFPLPLDCVLNLRGRIGYLQPNEGKPLPVYERYYLGGIGSLRGLRNVGPKDPATGDVIGGTTMMFYNAEIVFPLIKNAGMKGVVFYDTGNAWDGGYHFNDLRQTAGVGVRWYSPIGPLRLEWGHVLDRKEGEDPSRWEFTIGMFM